LEENLRTSSYANTRTVTLFVTTNLERSNTATHNENITTSDPSHTSGYISVFKTRKKK